MKILISKSQWEEMGKKAGWEPQAEGFIDNNYAFYESVLSLINKNMKGHSQYVQASLLEELISRLEERRKELLSDKEKMWSMPGEVPEGSRYQDSQDV